VIDLFAGGGGASLGIEKALGRRVDLALNHDPVALAVHKRNHPETRHLEADIWEVRPRDATEGKPVDFLWASPDCTHFSVAKGGKPRSKGIRSLAWAVIRWAKDTRPTVIMLENVAEFKGWGPLGEDGKPVKARMGETFMRWRKSLERLGYMVDHRVLDASRYGAPTRRRRLFIVARRDGAAIVWPEATHGPGLLPFRTAAQCIDWSLPCPSIFERKKLLAEKTQWRIAEGIKRFVINNPQPFIVGVGGRAGQSDPTGAEDPLGTITAKNDRSLVVPSLIKVNHGGRQPRGESLEEPMSTVTAQRRGHALVTPHLMKFRHDSTGASLEDPMPTITAGNAPNGHIAGAGHALGMAVASLVQVGYGEAANQAARALDIEKPLGTVVAGGIKHALVSAFLNKHFTGVVGKQMELPIDTITARDHHSLTAATLLKLRGDNHGADPQAPLPTVSAQGTHLAEVRAFLVTYYGQGVGQDVRKPMRTVTTKDRLGLVTIEGIDYQIVDIGMRMLEPHELLAAQFGTFAADYDLSPARTKTAKVRLIGNSVPPEEVMALVRVNVPPAAVLQEAA
jgi:DNA (cytosine-5)-methyltransferase 1